MSFYIRYEPNTIDSPWILLNNMDRLRCDVNFNASFTLCTPHIYIYIYLSGASSSVFLVFIVREFLFMKDCNVNNHQQSSGPYLFVSIIYFPFVECILDSHKMWRHSAADWYLNTTTSANMNHPRCSILPVEINHRNKILHEQQPRTNHRSENDKFISCSLLLAVRLLRRHSSKTKRKIVILIIIDLCRAKWQPDETRLGRNGFRARRKTTVGAFFWFFCFTWKMVQLMAEPVCARVAPGSPAQRQHNNNNSRIRRERRRRKTFCFWEVIYHIFSPVFDLFAFNLHYILWTCNLCEAKRFEAKAENTVPGIS